MLNIISWVKKNRAIVLTVSFITLLGLGLGIAFIKQMKSIEERGWEMLAAAQFLSLRGQAAEAHQVLAQLESRYGRQKLADFGMLVHATLYAREGRWDEAVKKYKAILENKKTKQLQPMTILGLGRAYEAMGKTDEAIAEFQNFLSQYPDHFAAAHAHEGLARLYETKGDWPKAKEHLERMRVLFPDSIWAQRAQAKLQLGPKISK